MGFIKAFIDIDTDKTGIINSNSWIKLGSQLAGMNVDVKSNQIQGLYNRALDQINYYDKDGNKELDLTEIEKFFTDINLPTSYANQFIESYKNSNGQADVMSFLKAFIDIDTDKTGIINAASWIKLGNLLKP